MNETPTKLVQPLTYRVWSPKHQSFFYTDVQPEVSEFVDRWTGLFDKQCLPLYENDIIQVHYDWKFGWVRALVMRAPEEDRYIAQSVTKDGHILRIGYYCFADSYRLGNLREHRARLAPATEQFQAEEAEPWWLREKLFPSATRSWVN